MSNIASTLKNFGLTANQTKVYLAALELGDARAQDIAKRAKVLRQTTYEVLDSLAAMGLLNHYRSRGARRYVPEPPARLAQLLDERKREIAQALPELTAIFQESGSYKPRVKYYEGIEAMKALYEDTLTTSDRQLLAILSVRDLVEAFGQEWLDPLYDRRIKAGIHIRVVRDRAREMGALWTESVTDLRRVRYAPESFSFPLTMYLYDNKVVIFSTKHENFGMMIESKEFFKTQKALFEVLWGVSASLRPSEGTSSHHPLR